MVRQQVKFNRDIFLVNAMMSTSKLKRNMKDPVIKGLVYLARHDMLDDVIRSWDNVC